MRMMRVDGRACGLPLAEAACDRRGQPIVRGGTVLTDDLIDKLSAAGVQRVLVDDPRFQDMGSAPIASEHTRRLGEPLFVFANTPAERQRAQEPISYHRMAQVLEALIEDAQDAPLDCAAMLYPSQANERDLVHALNRAGLALRLTYETGLSRFRRDIGMAALVADIGMSRLPVDVRSRSKLSAEEYEQIKQHVGLTLEWMPTEAGWSSVARAAVRQHHERFDGSGYPHGLRGDQIHRASRLLAICDVYTALLLDRGDRLLYAPHEAHDHVLARADQDFDYHMVSAFSRIVPPFPVGTEVHLSNGYAGVVVRVGTDLKALPIVRLIEGPGGKRLPTVRDVDLAAREYQHITIVGAEG